MEAIIVVIGHTILDSLLSAFPRLLFCSTKTVRNSESAIVGCHDNLFGNNNLGLSMVRFCVVLQATFERRKPAHSAPRLKT